VAVDTRPSERVAEGASTLIVVVLFTACGAMRKLSFPDSSPPARYIEMPLFLPPTQGGTVPGLDMVSTTRKFCLSSVGDGKRYYREQIDPRLLKNG
jgi:hypothetical protein